LRGIPRSEFNSAIQFIVGMDHLIKPFTSSAVDNNMPNKVKSNAILCSATDIARYLTAIELDRSGIGLAIVIFYVLLKILYLARKSVLTDEKLLKTIFDQHAKSLKSFAEPLLLSNLLYPHVVKNYNAFSTECLYELPIFHAEK